MAQPISPDEALRLMIFTIPDQMIDAVNELLTQKIRPNSRSLVIKQKDVEALVLKKFKQTDISMTQSEIHANGWILNQFLKRLVGRYRTASRHLMKTTMPITSSRKFKE